MDTVDWRQRTVSVLAIGTSLVHFYAPVFGAWNQLRVVSLALYLLLTFLLYPLWQGRGPGLRRTGRVIDACWILVVACIGAWLAFDYESFIARTGDLTPPDAVAGVLLIAAVLEGTRRSLGWPLVVLAILFLAFAHWGQQMPLLIAHAGAAWEDIVEFTFRDSAGIFGIPVAVMAGYVVLFIIMGSILEASGAGALMLEFSRCIAGRAVAGPAKIAVISSSLMGTISGSAVANVVTTGAFTIPLMKKVGIRPHVAAAIEAVASTGGIIMPPVMGAAAFIAAQNAGTSYAYFIIAATLPAVLYYVALFLMVDLEGRRDGLAPYDDGQQPSLRNVGRRGWWIPLPFVALVWMLVVGYSPVRSAGVALVLLIVLISVTQGWRSGLGALIQGMDQGSRATAALMVAAAASGIVIAMVHVSGIGLRFTHIIVTLGQGSQIVTLGLVAFATLVLGMGLPITAAYLTAATLAVPALNNLGVPSLGAHLFVLYFAAISAITPPVALASFAAAGIAQANVWSTGMYAVRLGLTGFIVPFLFIDRPGLLILGTTFWEVTYAFATALLGLVALTVGAVGFVTRPVGPIMRITLFASGILLALLNDWWLDAIGITLCVLCVLVYRRGRPRGAAVIGPGAGTT